jgi:hypothetical protein
MKTIKYIIALILIITGMSLPPVTNYLLSLFAVDYHLRIVLAIFTIAITSLLTVSGCIMLANEVIDN